MQVSHVNRYNENSFGAKINLQSRGISEYKKFLDKQLNASKGVYYTRKNIELFDKICDAFEKHPSKEIINADVSFKIGEEFNTRGVLETSLGNIVDIEPARNVIIYPIENIFRKLLNPENKEVFNKLLGTKYSKNYDNWWNANIKPIWNDIEEVFQKEKIIVYGADNNYNSAFRTLFSPTQIKN